MEPKNRFQRINSISLCSPVDRYDNPIPTRFLAHIDCLKIPGLVGKRSQFPTSMSSTSGLKIQKITDYSNKQLALSISFLIQTLVSPTDTDIVQKDSELTRAMKVKTRDTNMNYIACSESK
jgi:hypothetical protein